MTCTAKAVNAFGFAAAHEYIKANFAEESKADADAMVENLRSAFKELVSETDWMDSATQAKAAEKADQMLQLIGYPDWLTDPSEVDSYYLTAPATSEQEHFMNMISTGHWAAIQDLKTLREEPKREIWLMHPAIVNGWNPPGSILQRWLASLPQLRSNGDGDRTRDHARVRRPGSAIRRHWQPCPLVVGGNYRCFWRQGPVLHRPVQQLHRAGADPHLGGGGRPPERGEHAGGEHRRQRGDPRVIQSLPALR